MTEHGSIIYVEDLTVSFDGFVALNKLNFFMDYGELRFVIGRARRPFLMSSAEKSNRPRDG